MTASKIVVAEPDSVDLNVVTQAASVIARGGLVIFPTNTFYGIAARALDVAAVDRVFGAKKRDGHNPLPVLIASSADLVPLVQAIPEHAARLMEAFWPGGLTLVFHAADGVPPNLTGYTGKIGIRLACHPVACALVRAVANPVTATSANLSGDSSCTAVANLNPHLTDHVDLVLDAGRLSGKKGSTVVDVTVIPPKILREGIIDAPRIRRVVEG